MWTDIHIGNCQRCPRRSVIHEYRFEDGLMADLCALCIFMVRNSHEAFKEFIAQLKGSDE